MISGPVARAEYMAGKLPAKKVLYPGKLFEVSPASQAPN